MNKWRKEENISYLDVRISTIEFISLYYRVLLLNIPSLQLVDCRLVCSDNVGPEWNVISAGSRVFTHQSRTVSKGKRDCKEAHSGPR